MSCYETSDDRIEPTAVVPLDSRGVVRVDECLGSLPADDSIGAPNDVKGRRFEEGCALVEFGELRVDRSLQAKSCVNHRSKMYDDSVQRTAPETRTANFIGG